MSQEALLDLLAEWLPTRRWFPLSADAQWIRDNASIVGDVVNGETHHLLVSFAGGPTVHVPLLISEEPGEEIIGTLGELTVSDAPTDARFLQGWLTGNQNAAGDPMGAAGSMTWEGRVPDVDLNGLSIRPIATEQSNSSVIIDSNPPMILKVLRTLAEGDNPDIHVPAALSNEGWSHVAAPLAWTRFDVPGSGLSGDGVVLSEYITDATDGFVLACSLAKEDADPTDTFTSLGDVIAQMHRILRTTFPEFVHPQSRSGLQRDLSKRAQWAFTELPELRILEDRVTRMIDALDDAPYETQRIHGDLHLGQVMKSASRGWIVLDFEGEPLRSIEERTKPDLALRDVAGMLRSFDYAAALAPAASDQWLIRAREAFLEGYGVAQSPALTALEVDKALYEIVYESRNRPDMQHIPADALKRLLSL